MVCPKCRSCNVVHKDHEMKEMSHRAKHLGAHNAVHALQGHPAGLVMVGGAWLIAKAVHAFSKPWTCQDCKHTFA